MQTFNEEENQSGMRVVFMVVQIIVLAIVYIFVYTSLKAVEFAIAEYDTSAIMYFPVFIAMVIFPVLLYRYRQMFNGGKMLIAFSWMMATASLTIVLLYVYIAQIT